MKSENRKIKILCVEDEQDIRENIAEILRGEGFEVFESDNGKHGFESFIQNKPDIIISDIMMPEIDGYGLLKLVRESNTRNNNAHFIFLTALGQKDNVIKGINLTANDYLVKPIDFDLLIAKVKEKAVNAIRVEETHTKNIKNIKSQVSVMLSNEMIAQVDLINQIAGVLKTEPYGPFPHRRYIDDINKIFTSAVKLKVEITNMFDEKVIDHKLNANDEIFLVAQFAQNFTNQLSDKTKEKIAFQPPYESESFPNVKLDKLVLTDVFRKVFAGLLKSETLAAIALTAMVDPQNQVVIVFSTKSKQPIANIEANINVLEINKLLDPANCRLSVAKKDDDVTCTITIPSYRVIKK